MLGRETVKQMFEENPKKFRILVKTFDDYYTFRLALLRIDYAKFYAMSDSETKYLFYLATK